MYIKKDFFVNFLLILLSSILYNLAFIYQGFELLIFFSQIPIIYLLTKLTKKRYYFIYGIIYGIINYSILFYWEIYIYLATWILLSLYHAFIVGLLFLIFGILRQKCNNITFFYIPVMVLWEFMREIGDLAFPWGNIGYALGYYKYLIQVSEIFGVLGVSLFVYLINLLLYLLLISNKTKDKYKLIFTIIIIFVIYLQINRYLYNSYKNYLMNNENKANLNVLVIQPNIQQDDKWEKEIILNNYYRLISDIDSICKREKNIDLVITPESVTAMYTLYHPEEFRAALATAINSNVNILLGSMHYEYKEKKTYYNQAILIQRNGDYSQIYNKIHLVPFAEYFSFSFLGRLLLKTEILRKIIDDEFTPGKEVTNFVLDNNIKFISGICFEAIFSFEVAKRFKENNTDFYVNIVNDAWFKNSFELEQHAIFSIFRAIENRKHVIRSANTGISLIVNPLGEVISISQKNKKMFLNKMLDIVVNENKKTFFSKFSYLLVILSFVWILINIILLKYNFEFRRIK